MPGITGIIARTPQHRNRRSLDIMLGGMLDEPFYAKGTYVQEKLGAYAGWTCHQVPLSVNDHSDKKQNGK